MMCRVKGCKEVGKHYSFLSDMRTEKGAEITVCDKHFKNTQPIIEKSQQEINEAIMKYVTEINRILFSCEEDVFNLDTV